MMSEIIGPWPSGISSLINEKDKSRIKNFFFLQSRLLSMKRLWREWGLTSKKKFITKIGEGIQIGKAEVCPYAFVA